MIRNSKLRTYVAITLMALIAWMGQAQEADVVKMGDAMPTFRVVSDKGETLLSTDQLKGKVVLVNFFATWCPPCQKELAAVQETLWPKYKDNDQFALVASIMRPSWLPIMRRRASPSHSIPIRTVPSMLLLRRA